MALQCRLQPIFLAHFAKKHEMTENMLNITDTKPANDSMRNAARDHVEAGFNLIRLHRMTPEGACTCYKGEACGQLGKHPMDRKDARPDYQTHDALLQVQLDGGHFDQSFGVLLDGTDTLVVDIDARNGGLIGFEKLVADFPEVAGAGYIVETGSGGGSRHLYFTAPKGLRLKSALKEYPGIDFKSTGWVVAPGSLHKSGGRYSVALGSLDDIDAAPDGLLEAPKKPTTEEVLARRGIKGQLSESAEHFTDMLTFIEPKEYETWIAVGMALKAALDDDGFHLWDSWSSTADSYNPDEMLGKWDSFDVEEITGGKILWLARQGGYEGGAGPEYTRMRAEEIWKTAQDVEGTPGEAWMRGQGFGNAGPALRFYEDSRLGPVVVARNTVGGIVRLPLSGGEVWPMGPADGGVVVLSHGESVVFAVDLADGLRLLARFQEAGKSVCVVAMIKDQNLGGMKPSSAFSAAAVYATNEAEAWFAGYLDDLWRKAGACGVRLFGPAAGVA